MYAGIALFGEKMCLTSTLLVQIPSAIGMNRFGTGLPSDPVVAMAMSAPALTEPRQVL